MSLKVLVSRWLPSILWMVFIFTLSSLPGADFSSDRGKNFVVRKTLHIIEYSVLCLAFFRATKSAWRSSFFSILYALSDEFHQALVLGRTGKIEDVLFDGFGALATGFVLWRYFQNLPNKLKDWLRQS